MMTLMMAVLSRPISINRAIILETIPHHVSIFKTFTISVLIEARPGLKECGQEKGPKRRMLERCYSETCGRCAFLEITSNMVLTFKTA